MPNQIAGASLNPVGQTRMRRFGAGAMGAGAPYKPAPGPSVMSSQGQWVPPNHPDAMDNQLQAMQPPAQGSGGNFWGGAGQVAQALQPGQMPGQAMGQLASAPAPPPAPSPGPNTIGDLYAQLQMGPSQPPSPSGSDVFRPQVMPGRFEGGFTQQPTSAMPEAEQDERMRQLIGQMGQGGPQPMGQQGNFAPQRGRLGDLMARRRF